MAIHASPGVYFEIIDFSIYGPKLSKTILALVGKTKKGPTEPTFVSSVRQYVETFGVPGVGDYSALAAISFLEFGNALWFSRLVGPAAVKATAEIPKAVEVNDELLTAVDDTGKYIFSATLANSPIPNSLSIKVVDPDDDTNFITIEDDGNGSFSSIQNSNITNYPNFIDYDTGEFRFTVEDTVPDASEISLKYNYKEFTVSDESTLVVEEVNGVDFKYNGVLAHSNIINADTTFELKVEVGTDVFTFTTSGPITEGVFTLEGVDQLATTVGSGNLNVNTGAWDVTFTGGNNVELNDIFVADYKYCTFKTKFLGTVAAVNPEGGTYGYAYIGNLNTVVAPNSVSILVDDGVVSEDNGEGRFVTGVTICENKVDYDAKTVEFALISPPANTFNIYVSYLAKHNSVLETIGVGGSTGGNVSTILTETPVVKNNLVVHIGPDNSFTDNGEGEITGIGINGTIDYNTGELNINYAVTLVEGDIISVDYLSRLGVAECNYEGEFYNGIDIEFYRDNFYNYGLKIWNSTQNVNQNPEEHFKDISFDDPNVNSYFINKVHSRLINLVLDDETGTDKPVFNTVLTLSGGDSDESNITTSSAISALSDFANAEQYDINLIACPDYPGDKTVINKIIQVCEVQRGDCFSIIDTPRNLTKQQAVDWHNGAGSWANENAINTRFTAIYYPWVQVSDEFTESLQWVPPSVRMVSVYAYSDRVAEVWNAPAGLNRGRLFRTLKVETQLNANDRDLLYATGTNCINPICDFVGDGIVVYGQKTAQRKPSSLNRVNVVRLIIYMTKILATATRYLLFEPNDILTWTLYSQMVNPVVEDIKNRRGLYEFKVVCDETTNTAYDIDDNTMVAEVWLKPTKTAERLINRFVITNTGANFSELESL